MSDREGENANWRDWISLGVTLVGISLIIAGVGSILGGGPTAVRGMFWLVAGLLAFPISRGFIIGLLFGDIDDRTETIVVAVIVISGVALGGIAMVSSPGGSAASGATPSETTSAAATTTSPPPTTTIQSTTTTTTPATTRSTTTREPISEQSSWTVQVVEVIDGDTMDVRMPDGSVETIRLLGVDTPETSVNEVSPDEWEGVPDTVDGRDWLANWGDRASRYATDRLAGETVYIETDTTTDRRGYYGRLLVYIYQSESAAQSFNYRLIDQGYARLYESEFQKRTQFVTAQDLAQASDVGVWGYTRPEPNSMSGIHVTTVHADAEGYDHENLNGEYIELTNYRTSAVDMSGWTLSDSAGHTFNFPTGFSLDAGDSVTIYTGSGTDTSAELYWGADAAIWNNGGDTIYLINSDGDTILEYDYS